MQERLVAVGSAMSVALQPVALAAAELPGGQVRGCENQPRIPFRTAEWGVEGKSSQMSDTQAANRLLKDRPDSRNPSACRESANRSDSRNPSACRKLASRPDSRNVSPCRESANRSDSRNPSACRKLASRPDSRNVSPCRESADRSDSRNPSPCRELADRPDSRNPSPRRELALSSSSRGGDSTLSSETAVRWNSRGTKMDSVPWHTAGENLWNFRGETDQSAVRDFKIFISRLKRFDMHTVVTCAKESGLEVIELPKTLVKRWIHDTRNNVDRRCMWGNGDAFLLSRGALCFTSTEPAVIITLGKSLPRVCGLSVTRDYRIACEIIVAASRIVENGGALPARVNPSTIYICNNGHQRFCSFLPQSEPQPGVETDASHQDGVASFIKDLADVVHFLTLKIINNDLFIWSGIDKTLKYGIHKMSNRLRVVQFLMWRAQMSGFKCQVSTLRDCVTKQGYILSEALKPRFWSHRRKPELQSEALNFIATSSVLIDSWENLGNGAPHAILQYGETKAQQLEKLVNLLRGGTVAHLEQAGQWAQRCLIEEETRALAAETRNVLIKLQGEWRNRKMRESYAVDEEGTSG